VDVRVITAANCDLPQLVAEQGFRSDLQYQLGVFPVLIFPPR
jgi:transcriptional regulator with GAF, ATPase, and Fis domain